MLTLADIGTTENYSCKLCLCCVCVYICGCLCALMEIPMTAGEFQDLFSGILQAAGIFSKS